MAASNPGSGRQGVPQGASGQPATPANASGRAVPPANVSTRTAPPANVSARVQPQGPARASVRVAPVAVSSPSGRLPQQPQPQVLKSASGRAPAQQPQQQVLKSASGRMVAVQPAQQQLVKSPSGRMVAVQSAQQQVAKSPSGRMVAVQPAQQQVAKSASGRMPAQQPAAAAAAPRPASVSSRITRREDGPRVSKVKRRRKGPELLIAFAVLAVMGVLAGVLYVTRNKQIRDVEQKKAAREETYENNMKLGMDMYMKAEECGVKFVIGKEDESITGDEQKLRAKLFGRFQKDDKIYNVIYDRRYKDKKTKEKNDIKQLFADRTHLETIQARSKQDHDIRLNYVMAENRTFNCVMASKIIPPAPGDTVNQGGTITIIVKAQDDPTFQSARKPPEVDGKPGEKK